MGWVIALFMTSFILTCSAKGLSKVTKEEESSSGISSTVDRNIEYGGYTVQATANWMKELTDKGDTKKIDKADRLYSKSKIRVKFGRMAKFIGKLTPFLGVMGFLIPFVLSFFGAKSQTLQKLEQGFFEVNDKLNDIDEKIEEVQGMIGTTQKFQYKRDKDKITKSYSQFQKMLQELKEKDKQCGSKRAKCLREKSKIGSKYMGDLKKAEDAVYSLVQGFKGHSSYFSEPIMNLVRTESKCSIPKLMNVYRETLMLASKGKMVEIAQKKMADKTTNVLELSTVWQKDMYELRKQLYDATKICYKKVHDTVKDDLQAMSGKSVALIRKKLQSKYDWVQWVSTPLITYIPLSYPLSNPPNQIA